MERMTERDLQQIEKDLAEKYGQSTVELADFASRNLAVALHELRLLMRERTARAA